MARLLLLFCAICSLPAAAQRIAGDLALGDTTALHSVQLKYGQGVLRGRVFALKSDELCMTFDGDTLCLPTSAVQTVSTIRTRKGDTDFQQSASASHFLNPTARAMPAGTGYYRNSMVFFNEVSYQFSPEWSGSLSTVSFWVGTVATLKYTQPLAPGVHGAVQARAGVVWPILAGSFTWSVMPLLTLGDERHYVTLGVQYVRAGDEIFSENEPVGSLLFSGSATLSSRGGHRWHLEMVNTQVVNLGWSRYKNRNEFGVSLIHTFNLLPSTLFLTTVRRAPWVPLPVVQYKRFF